MLINLRLYLEIGVALILVVVLSFYKIEDSRLTSQLTYANQKIGVLNAAVESQNKALEDLKKAQEAADKSAKEALEKARLTAKTEYNKSAEILSKRGATCDDTYNLFMESVK